MLRFVLPEASTTVISKVPEWLASQPAGGPLLGEICWVTPWGMAKAVPAARARIATACCMATVLMMLLLFLAEVGLCAEKKSD